MTDVNATLPAALRRALELFADPQAQPDISKGYLDLLGEPPAEGAAVPKNTGAIQAVWASPIGSLFYDNAQALARRLFTFWQHPAEWLNIPRGGIALDVGCGPGSVTASLAEAVGEGRSPWASTYLGRCWPARSRPTRGRRSGSSGRTRSGCRCATPPWMQLSRLPFCS